tara:strand:- start:198 stop:323 length:126 start_codon:yes stop_codon:yes gene_type:complete
VAELFVVNIKIDVLVEPRGSDTKLPKYLEKGTIVPIFYGYL